MNLTRWSAAGDSSGDDPEEFRASLTDHIEELRTRIIRVVLLLVVGWVVGWFLFEPVYSLLTNKSRLHIPKGVDYREVFRSITEPFMLKFKLSFYLGLILTLPFIVGQLWGFVAPGLTRREKASLTALAPTSFALFFLGAGLCWLVLPYALQWFAGYAADYAGAGIYQEPGTLVFFILKMMLAFGLGFQLPVVVFFLGKIGLLTPEALKEHWRAAVVAVFVVSMIITPSNDVISMLTMAIPLTALFGASVGAVNWSARRARREEKEALESDEATQASA